MRYVKDVSSLQLTQIRGLELVATGATVEWRSIRDRYKPMRDGMVKTENLFRCNRAVSQSRL